MLIDKTYFVKDINIPDSPYNDLDLNIFRYEKEILTHLLGYELTKKIGEVYPQIYYIDDQGNHYVDSNGNNYTGIYPKIIDLVEGKEYEVDGKLVKWNGLINVDKISLIAYYVFYQWARNTATFTTSMGERQSDIENSQTAGIIQRMNNAWLRLQLLAQDINYPYNSLYMFLSQHEVDYPEWVFTPIENVNGFDL